MAQNQLKGNLKSKLLFQVLVVLAVTIFIFSNLNAQKVMIIRGCVLGYDGKPMKKANVSIKQIRPHNKLIYKSEVAPDGKFTATINEKGFYFIFFYGVNHSTFETPLVIEKNEDIEITTRLSTYKYNDSFDNVMIIGDFNNYSFDKPQKMEKQPDGTFHAEFKTSAKKITYQILGVEKNGRGINSLMSDDYEFDGSDYKSIVFPKDGKVKIVFNPKELGHSDKKGNIQFKNPKSATAKYANIWTDIQNVNGLYNNAYKEYEETGRDPKSFKFDWSQILNELTQRINNEKDKITRQCKEFIYLGLFRFRVDDLDPKIIKMSIDEIGPTSSIWCIDPYLIQLIYYFASESIKSGYEVFLDKVYMTHSDPEVRANALYSKIVIANTKNDPDALEKLIIQIEREFPNTDWGKSARNEYSPKRNIMEGKTIPAFSFMALEDSNIKFTNENMKGKYYLIDFWATWCGPCIGEMEYLHQAYDRFKGKNFEILSLSFDGNIDDVIKYRQGKWKMPWLHSFIPDGFSNKDIQSFEVNGIPRPILVDPTGKIIAVKELRGEALIKTTAKFLGE